MNDVIMDGVWIINVRQETVSPDFIGALIGAILGALAACILTLILAFIVVYTTLDDCDWCILVLVPMLMIGIGVGGKIGDTVSKKINSGDVVYDVMIGDNVSFNEFTEQYEIIEHNGNIYTVKERTNR